jgi:hypothetical protein
MANTTIAQLRTENDDLRKLVIKLGSIVLRNVLEQTELPKPHRLDPPPLLPAALSPNETVLRLRELAVRYAHMSRLCVDRPTAEELDSLSVELAEAAQRMEALFAVPWTDSDGEAV